MEAHVRTKLMANEIRRTTSSINNEKGHEYILIFYILTSIQNAIQYETVLEVGVINFPTIGIRNQVYSISISSTEENINEQDDLSVVACDHLFNCVTSY